MPKIDTKFVRNVITLAIGLSLGIYAGENLPELYYDPIKRYLPKLNVQPSSQPILGASHKPHLIHFPKPLSQGPTAPPQLKSKQTNVGDTPVTIFTGIDREPELNSKLIYSPHVIKQEGNSK